jgi:hypothetical protein
LHQRIYENIVAGKNEIIDIRRAIEHIDENELSILNSDVKQKDPTEDE